MGDCRCDMDGEWWACVAGSVYGPCEYGQSDDARPLGACW